MSTSPAQPSDPDDLARSLGERWGRRAVLRAAAATTVGPAALLSSGGAEAQPQRHHGGPVRILQPGHGRTRGHYVPAKADEVLWGRLPNRDTAPVAVVTMDTISHEGVLEDQGKDPRAFFESYGVPERAVLRDAVAVAAHTPHDGPGPHVVTGPIAVRGAHPGDVLKIECWGCRCECRTG